MGITLKTSSVSPELDINRTISLFSIIPKSPWYASAGCIKKLGVPVLDIVAEIFLPIIPDFPIPETISFPLDLKIASTAFSKSSVKLFERFKTSLASIIKTSLAINLYPSQLLL